MPKDTTPVIKTLVIGLGSTGTRVCNFLAERIRWELTDLQRAPWVRFLCIETNANEPSDFHASGDFRSITITRDDYENILQNLTAFDEKILLSRWADKETLERLPDREVGAGAGNIRMVGRLAFLWEPNYNLIKYAITDRLNKLRDLTEPAAKEKRGKLADGSDPGVQFASKGQIRIVVVGTLCGGTCSGTVSDFGHFVRSMCGEEEKAIGIFTLPRPDLTPVLAPRADRFKRNAYAALVELNHYHLAGMGEESPIRYPDGVMADTTKFPYDTVYLATPRRVGGEGEEDLNRVLADRLFLNVFVPQTDPAATTADATIFDREHRAHVFCSFGLSTVEFPAYQVIEACSARLMAHALREWQERPLPPDQEAQRLEGLGLTWAGLLNFLCEQQSGVSLQTLLRKKAEEVVALAKTNVAAAEQSLEQLRAAFGQWAQAEGDAALAPGVVPAVFAQNRGSVPQMILERTRQHIRARLLDYYDGPGPARQILQRAQERILDIQRTTPRSYEPQVETVDGLVAQLRVCHDSPTLSFMLLKGAAIDRIIPQLEEALGAELQERLNTEAHRVLHPSSGRAGIEDGVLNSIANSLRPVQTRVNNLHTILSTMVGRLRTRANNLARMTPDINGLCIFDPETPTGDGGTVTQEYQRCLRRRSGDPSISWDRTQERVATDVINAWTNLPDAVVPAGIQEDRDWLLADVEPNSSREMIPTADRTTMERTAREPFLPLAQVDVLERWNSRWTNEAERNQLAATAARQSRPFLDIVKGLAEQGNRSPIHIRRTLMTPSSPYRDGFVSATSTGLEGDVQQAECPDPFRSVLLEEWYRFPLSGVQSILGSNGIHTARCTDFPTFHTRNDIYWTGLSTAEVTNLREGEELAAVAILLGVLEPKGGALVLPWTASMFGDTGERRLPLSLRGAAQFLAREERDLRRESLQGARAVVRTRIEEVRRAGEELRGAARDRAFIARLRDAWNAGTGTVLPDWQPDVVSQFVTRFCARSTELYQAYVEAFPPDRALIASLRRTAGDPKPRGGVYDRDGLYCPECGGLVGENEQEAAANGWRCYVNPDHYFGPRVGTR